MGTASGAGFVYLSGFCEVRVAQSLIFCVVFSCSLFVLFLLAIVLSVLRFQKYELKPKYPYDDFTKMQTPLLTF
jgi:hypothetical protein